MRAILKDGRAITLNAEQGQRVLYALTTLANTPIGDHLNVSRVEGDAGEDLWTGKMETAGQ